MAGQGMDFLSAEEASVTSIPEAALAVAVLHRAVLDCLAEGVPAPVRRNAYHYLTGEDRSWPFSFLNVAEHLSEDAEAFRVSVLTFIRQSVGCDNLDAIFYGQQKPRGPNQQRPSGRLRYCRNQKLLAGGT
jgi:hypothetical protein